MDASSIAPGLSPALTLAQSPAADSGSIVMGLWPLFVQSFDLFSIVLILGSVAAVAIIVRNLFDVRAAVIAPKKSLDRIADLCRTGRLAELEHAIADDKSFIGDTLRPALGAKQAGRDAMHEAANLGASEAHAHWSRRVEPLAIIGNLAPLVGLAGTVWGMILAFASLSAAGGRASPTELSLGISKALMHTLLGLMLAIPALAFAAFFRARIERAVGRAVVVCAEAVDRLASGPKP
ncbi:MAG: MotA/TolQ/ExbB proton channel family protein [Phycisphaeraceae bacterium]|nr:MotA/TolQ/ExbB proton channel family protein [Phycisphaeraceae bacterium]MBX3368032.1 MotA/TolQ/ExbB proton channel family protein [Phycisphaeraceae bacterium]QYK48059.1 MAG: MotA/TolQ/ExbB proton channel family protein [Phycisphaeraceae bacterium]